ncbi:hypothetical protein LPJ53_004825, partial [Coemansia erecta]
MVLGRYLSQLDVLCGNVTPLIAKYDIDLALTKVYFVFNDIVKQIFMRTDVSRLQSIEILENPAAQNRPVDSKRKAWDRHKLRIRRYATGYGIRLKRQADLCYNNDSRLLDRIDGDLADLPPGDDRDDL